MGWGYNVSRWSRRRRSWLCAAVVTLLSGTGIVAAAPAQAAQQCTAPPSLFAVVAATGHLVEVGVCTSPPGFGPAVTVDDGDWRGDLPVFGASDSTAVVLYTIDADGALWARRRNAPGAGFGTPVRVAETIDWSRFANVFVAKAGYLHAVEHVGPIRTFRHANWSTGGTEVVEEQPLLHRAGAPMSVVKWGGFGEAVVGSVHVRIWLEPSYPERSSSDGAYYESGNLPPDVTSAVGYEPWLYGIDAAGDLVQMYQSPKFALPGFKACNMSHWNVVARSSGGYARVIQPMGRNSPVPTPGLAARATEDRCLAEPPLEWQ
jgi:hypothetical protein